MADIQVQLRRGTATEHNTFTGAVGEVTVDTTNDTLRVHDGSTAGGVRLAKLSEAGGGTGTVTSVDSGTGLTGGPITTSGTLSIASGGVDTTQLANDGVTFAKMQNINTAKVIGRTSAGSGDPQEVSILDEDAMTSNSATALATQQSIKAYVDAQVGSSLTVFAKGFIDTFNSVSRSTNIASSSYSAVNENFTINFTSAAASPHATHIVQATPRVSAANALANFTCQYIWNSSTQLLVKASGIPNINGISLIIFS